MATKKRDFGNPLAGHYKYRKLEDLSSGTYGFVQKCQNLQTGEVIAVKFIKRGKNISKYVEREVINQSNLHHPHIVGFKEVFLTKDHLAIALEYVPGGNVLQYLMTKGTITENEARRIFQQLITGVDFLHQKNIVNRDIKLENTMLDCSTRPLVKITDFGLCKSTATDSAPKSTVGTPGCMAPEVLIKKMYCGKKADAWSCGVMLYAMLFAAYPFERLCDQYSPSAVNEVWRRILDLDYFIPEEPAVSEGCKDLIRRILIREPPARLTISQIQEHPWYKDGLPEGVTAMNQRFGKVNPHDRPGYQTIKVIKDVIQYARQEDDFPLDHASSTDSNISDTLSQRHLSLGNPSDSRALV